MDQSKGSVHIFFPLTVSTVSSRRCRRHFSRIFLSPCLYVLNLLGR